MKKKNISTEKEESKIAEPFIAEKVLKYVKISGWHSKTPKQKKNYIISSIVFTILGIASCVYFAFLWPITKFFNDLAAPIQNPFCSGFIVSVPKIFSTIGVVTLTILILRIVNIVVNSITFSNQKAVTISKLINSGIRYIAWIVALLICLAFWGVNTAGILASAGILTLLCAIPARTIADDLIAGVFIVFEGNLEVGDIVTYSGFKGTIREIGLRITKIENLNNDINVIRNSDIRNIINNSVNTSQVIYCFDLVNKISYEKVKAAIESIKSVAKVECQDISSDIAFLGVKEISSGTTKYSIGFKCKEKRSLQSQRYIGQLLKSTFEKAGFYD